MYLSWSLHRCVHVLFSVTPAGMPFECRWAFRAWAMNAGVAVGTAATPAGSRGAAGAEAVPAAPVTANARAQTSDSRIDRARTGTPRKRTVRTGRGCHTDRGRTRGLPYVPAVAFEVIP